jgi:Domain of unknown function (DUF5666)
MKAILVLASAGALVAPPAWAALPEDIAVGTRVEIEGARSGPGEVTARRIALRHAAQGPDEIEAAVDAVDAAARRLVVGGVPVEVLPDAQIQDGGELTTDLGRVRPGVEVEADGRFENGVLRASSLETSELDAEEVHAVEIEGAISDVDPASGSFRVLGQRVVVTPRTKLRIH